MFSSKPHINIVFSRRPSELWWQSCWQRWQFLRLKSHVNPIRYLFLWSYCYILMRTGFVHNRDFRIGLGRLNKNSYNAPQLKTKYRHSTLETTIFYWTRLHSKGKVNKSMYNSEIDNSGHTYVLSSNSKHNLPSYHVWSDVFQRIKHASTTNVTNGNRFILAFLVHMVSWQ